VVELTDDRGRLVAHAGMTYMRLGREPDAAPGAPMPGGPQKGTP